MMKANLMAAVVAASGVFAAAPADAQQRVYGAPTPSIAWNCKMSAQVAGVDDAFIFRRVDLWGHGTIRCTSVAGDRFDSPVVINFGSFSAGLQFAQSTGRKSCMRVGSGNIGVSDPAALFGSYRLNPLDINFQGGAKQSSVAFGMQVSGNRGTGGISGQVQLNDNCGTSVGFGVGVGVSGLRVMTQEQANAYRISRGLGPMPRRPVAVPSDNMQAPPPPPVPRMRAAPAVPVQRQQGPQGPRVAPAIPVQPQANDNNPPPPPPPKAPAAPQYEEETPPPPPPAATR